MGIITALATVAFVIVCVALMLAILIQPGKGEGLSALTGMSQQMFGGGAMTFLAKVTAGLAIAYMVLVFLLAKLLQPAVPSVEATMPASSPSTTQTAPPTGAEPSTTPSAPSAPLTTPPTGAANR